jgi:hypothetical protein
MTRLSATSMELANLGGAKTGTEISVSGIVSPLQATITNILKSKEPRKTWAFLCDLLYKTARIEMTERVAKHRLANTRSYTIEELQALLQSDDGLDFLVAIMDDAEPKWWWWAKQVMTLAAVRRRRAEDEQEILKLETSAPAEHGSRRRIKGALDASKRVGTALARAETAVGFRRPERDGGVDSDRGGVAGVSHRPVAPSRKRA